MTFEEMGAILRSQRENKNLNINDVANQLKINPRHLRAMEEGDIGALPHPAYVRGFIRSYARLLGFGEEEVQEILDSIPGLSSAQPAKRSAQKSAVEDREGKSSSGAFFKILVLLCIAGAALYYLWDAGYLDFIKSWQDKGEQQSAELQRADSYMAAKDAEKAKREAEAALPHEEESRAERILPIPGNQPIPAPPALEAEPIVPQARAELEESVPAMREADLPPSQESAPEENAEASTSGQHKLIITAVEECWIHSNADKTDTRQFSLRKGDTFALTFADSLELKLGNAGGVRLRYDGSDLPPPGNSGQVRTLTFPPKNNS